MAKLQPQNTPGFNVGNNYLVTYKRISDIVINPEIANIFSISEKTLEDIKEKIKKFGYNREEPITIWKGNNTLVDGRTRYTAAKDAGLQEIPVVEREFDDIDAAILYTIHRQVLRRNLTGAEILRVTKMLPEERNRKGEGSAAENLAKELKVSPSTIYQAQRVAREGSPKTIEKVNSGDMSIKAAYKETVGEKGENKPKALPEADAITNETSVEMKKLGESGLAIRVKLQSLLLDAHTRIARSYNIVKAKRSETNESAEEKLLREAIELLERAESGLAVLE